ncbi:MAG TPA: TlpA disulfide reductase family protein [Pyrinomonadaceae bacterium]|jgi:thiol-disulfide isomerase/thioredoxin|nr:TlpA disulfide reductase family protein [Pyrinomonadaceae bacterium]
MSPESTVADIAPQAFVAAGLDRAAQFQSQGKLEAAAAELEQTVQAARATPYEIEFLTRIRLGMMLADVYLALHRLEDARSFLAEETAFAERISQLMQATGTPNQKRQAMSGYLQIRDRTAQIGLLGNPAPEPNLRMWLVGDPVTLADLHGKVVMLEFWATWCKPCQEMFPKLTSLYEQESKNGLEILGITRHYMAYGGTLEAKNEELNLIRKTVSEHRVTFRVAVADDERLQSTFGANGLPTVVLIDRKGIVQYAGPGGEDPVFEKSLSNCLVVQG